MFAKNRNLGNINTKLILITRYLIPMSTFCRDLLKNKHLTYIVHLKK